MMQERNPSKSSLDTTVCQEQFTLLSEKAIYWERKQTLLLADLHLSKSGHFRKNGIPLPSKIHLDDLQRVSNLIEKYEPKRIIFLGDLFHSRPNEEWNQFKQWRKNNHDTYIQLVKGNHDSPDISLLQANGIDEVHVQMKEDSFLVSHEKCNETNEKYFNIYGHLHPAIHLTGMGRQSLLFSCFVVSKKEMVLPAFGTFTGNAGYAPAKEDEIFAIINNQIRRVPSINPADPKGKSLQREASPSPHK